MKLFRVRVFNFPGWTLTLGLGSAFLLLGRWWFERRPWVGLAYPFLSIHAMDVAVAVIGGHVEVLGLQVAVTAVHLGLVAFVWHRGSVALPTSPAATPPRVLAPAHGSVT
ncbi:MAG: hypothetical protein IT380_03270 [Myxococcales bacterium]|nr:hypothetical protein [Myxococcales bacterium]